VLLALAAGLVSGCFRPMLAEDSAASALRGKIVLPPIDGRLGYHLHQRLEDRLGTARDADYRLQVALTTRDTGLAIAQDNTVTRRTVTAVAVWTLRARGVGAPVLRGQEVVESGYNATASLYATRTVERDIEERLAQEIAERISRRIQAQAETVLAARPA
jgi:hypothetical protein